MLSRSPWYPQHVIVAGTRLSDTEVASLAERLRASGMGECADRMVGEYREGTTLFHISDDERKDFVAALDDCPEDLRRLWASLNDPLAT